MLGYYVSYIQGLSYTLVVLESGSRPRSRLRLTHLGRPFGRNSDTSGPTAATRGLRRRVGAWRSQGRSY